MTEPIQFHTDLYRRDALELAAEKYQGRARIDLVEAGAAIVAQLEPLVPSAAAAVQALRDEFCTDALAATVGRLRELAESDSRTREHAGVAESGPPWTLLAPFSAGAVLGCGWVLESLSPIRGGATTMVLRHERDGLARVSIRRNGGAPLGVAYTDRLDFLLMNGGGGAAETEGSLRRVLTGLAHTLRTTGNGGPGDAVLAGLLPHTERHAPPSPAASNGAARAAQRSGPVAPHVDPNERTIAFDLDGAGISLLAVYDALLAFADRCYMFATRPDNTRFGIQLKPRGEMSTDALRVLVSDITNALNQVARSAVAGSPPPATAGHGGLAPLGPRQVDLDGLLAELEAADPATAGLGFQPERGPGHENLRVLNIRGTGACNSDCLFCIEKFNPTHRPMPSADATRQLILDAAGEFDMLFFASGEPTIHPKLFDYVELARSVGFTCFGMSSHFRTLADPRFALKILQAGFEYFDIALHAADATAQLEVNPIEDHGESLFEALKGLAVLLRLAEALGVRISVTHKIVVSRLNVTRLEPIVRATYERGVRHFILQPVRSLGLAPERQAKLAISEEGILPHLNELLRKTEDLGVVIKPYGFSRQGLFSGNHVEAEQNRVKNIYGKARRQQERPPLRATGEERPTDGRHWVEVRVLAEDRFGFASTGSAPVLDEALQRGVDLAFGCRMGSCGMCCARLLEGKVDQRNQIFLTDEQIQQGFVLLCQARPLTDVVLMACTDEEIDQL